MFKQINAGDTFFNNDRKYVAITAMKMIDEHTVEVQARDTETGCLVFVRMIAEW